MVRRALWSVVAVSLLAGSLSAQEPRPTFEVASVKSALGRGQNLQRGGLFQRPGTTVLSLIQFAYDLREFQVIGGPDWIREDLFEVNARAGKDDVPAAAIRLMVQSLLADRFKLVSHVEQREMGFFALVPARADGRISPYLHRVASREECRLAVRNEREKARPKPVTDYATVSFCGDLSNLASGASRYVEMPIFDRTGLTGTWMGDVYFDPSPANSPTQVMRARDPYSVPIEIALREQLGLELRMERGPVDVLVIESVQQPTQN